MYVIAGATGNTGSGAAASLLDRGEPVRAIVRSEQKGEPWRARGAEIAVGSLDDADALSRAIEGADGLYFLVPPDMQTPDINALYRRFADSLQTALKRTPVPHVVYLSTWGAELPDGPFPMHYAAEQTFRETGVPFTLLRASFFMENTKPLVPMMRDQGFLPSFFAPDRKIPMVTARDIGVTAANALLNPPAATEIIALTGPAEYSMNDAAAAYSVALNQPISVQRVPEESIVPSVMQMGASPSVAEFYRNMVVSIERGDIRGEQPRARFVRGAVSLDEFVRVLLAEEQENQRAA